MICDFCNNEGLIGIKFVNAIVSIYAGKYNVKLENGNYVYKDRIAEEGFEELKNGDKILFCKSCNTVERI